MADPVEHAASRIPSTPVLTVAAEIGVLKTEVRQLQAEMAAMGPCMKQTRDMQAEMQREMMHWRVKEDAMLTEMLQLKKEMQILKEENHNLNTLKEELQELRAEKARKKEKKKARKGKRAD